MNKLARWTIYIVCTAVTLLAIYVFLSGGNFMGKLDAFY